IGAACLLLWASAAAGLWSGVLRIPVGSGHIDFTLAMPGLFAGMGLVATGLWMAWDSKIGKVTRRERLLDRLTWKGDEHVLDVGCGRGLMLIGAARRLSTGKATGIDIWQAEDLSGNILDATLENARREGVADRVDVQSADMRQLPFPDQTFDA